MKRFVRSGALRHNGGVVSVALAQCHPERLRPFGLLVAMTRQESLANSTRSTLGPPPLPAAGERWALFIDIDGTLVDFAPRPQLVRIDVVSRELLLRLAHLLDGALAVLSGRLLDDVDRLMTPLRLPAGAMHGLQLRDSTGRVALSTPRAESAEQVERACAEGIEALDGVWLENKDGVGFSLHFRGAREQESAVHRLAQRVADASTGHYVVQLGDCVAELKPSGADKGTALAALLETAPFQQRRPIVLGDDLTDEKAFAAAARNGGFGIIVGTRGPTLARHRLASPQHVSLWLGSLARHLQRTIESA